MMSGIQEIQFSFWFLMPLIGLTAVAVFSRMFRASVYDALIVPMTAKWYKAVLLAIPPKSLILDVGIGTGAALIANKALLKTRKLRVVGIDYDAQYVAACAKSIESAGLSDIITVEQADFYQWEPSSSLVAETRANRNSTTTSAEIFDAVYFSGSLMIMPDSVAALSHAASLLRLDSAAAARIYVTQTFVVGSTVLSAVAKPILRFLLSIDFGGITTPSGFHAAVAKADLLVDRTSLLPQALPKSFTSTEQRFVILRQSS